MSLGTGDNAASTNTARFAVASAGRNRGGHFCVRLTSVLMMIGGTAGIGYHFFGPSRTGYSLG